jgi:hypothetical protein
VAPDEALKPVVDAPAATTLVADDPPLAELPKVPEFNRPLEPPLELELTTVGPPVVDPTVLLEAVLEDEEEAEADEAVCPTVDPVLPDGDSQTQRSNVPFERQIWAPSVPSTQAHRTLAPGIQNVGPPLPEEGAVTEPPVEVVLGVVDGRKQPEPRRTPTNPKTVARLPIG